jgi:hypothetical protein
MMLYLYQTFFLITIQDHIEKTFSVETMLFTTRLTPTNFRFTSVALGKNYKKLLGSKTGKKMQDVI